jgi:hypothetical protein
MRNKTFKATRFEAGECFTDSHHQYLVFQELIALNSAFITCQNCLIGLSSSECNGRWAHRYPQGSIYLNTVRLVSKSIIRNQSMVFYMFIFLYLIYCSLKKAEVPTNYNSLAYPF